MGLNSKWDRMQNRIEIEMELPGLRLKHPSTILHLNMTQRLTALEIKKKEFQQKMRGADTDEVQAFLDQVSLEVETLTIEKKDLQDDLSKVMERLDHYLSLESTIEKTL